MIGYQILGAAIGAALGLFLLRAFIPLVAFACSIVNG